MGYILLLKQGNDISYIQQPFSSETEAFAFAKRNGFSESNYEIVPEEEFAAYVQSQQQPQQQPEHIPVTQVQQQPRPAMLTNYRPHFATFQFIGRKKRM